MSKELWHIFFFTMYYIMNWQVLQTYSWLLLKRGKCCTSVMNNSYSLPMILPTVLQQPLISYIYSLPVMLNFQLSFIAQLIITIGETFLKPQNEQPELMIMKQNCTICISLDYCFAQKIIIICFPQFWKHTWFWKKITNIL